MLSTSSTPLLFNISQNEAQVLDFTPSAQTPERALFETISSHVTSRPRATALIGMGGTGKSTILTALANHPRIQSTFTTAICALQLGQRAVLSNLRHSFLPLIDAICPSETSHRLRALWNDPNNTAALAEAVRALSGIPVLLIFDDVWYESSVYQSVVAAVAQACKQPPGLTILMASRDTAVAAQIGVTHVRLDPRPPLGTVSRSILCCYANLSAERLDHFPASVKNAFDGILNICAGLPIALAVAGAAVYRDTIVMSHSAASSTVDHQYEAWIDFHESLEQDARLLGERGTSLHEQGLFGSIESSVRALKHIWPSWITIGPDVVFQMFSVVERKAWTPLHVLQRVSGLSRTKVKQLLYLFLERNIVSSSTIQDELCFRLHDLVLDYCMILAADSNVQWHGKLLKAYEAELRRDDEVDLHPTLRPWWQKPNYGEGYVRSNVVRHLLCYGAFNEALHLVLDYRWLQVLNHIEFKDPFEQAISDLRLLKHHLVEDSAPFSGRYQEAIDSTLQGVELVTAAMQMCVVPSSKNRAHASFQLYGRLSGFRESPLVAYCLWSVDRFAHELPLRPSPGVLRPATSVIERMLSTPGRVCWMALSSAPTELLVGVLNKGLRFVDTMSGENKYVEGEFVCHLTAELETDVSLTGGGSSQLEGAHSRNFVFHAQGVYFLASLREDLHHESDEGSLPVLCAPEDVDFSDSNMIQLPLIQQHDLLVYRPGYDYSGRGVGEVWLIEKRTGALVSKIDGEVGPIHVTHNGERIVCGVGNKLRTWCISEQRWVSPELSGPGGNVLFLAVSPAGERIASVSVSEDGNIRLWDIRDAQASPTSSILTGHSRTVTCVLFNKEGSLLFSGGSAEIFVWDVSDKSHVISPMHKFFIDSLLFLKCLCLSRDGSEIYASGELFDKVFVLRANGKDLGRNRASETQRQSKDIFDLCKTYAISADGETGLSHVKESDELILWKPCRVLQNELQVEYICEFPNFETPRRGGMGDHQQPSPDEESSSHEGSSSGESEDTWEILALAISNDRRRMAFVLREGRPLVRVEGFIGDVDNGVRPWWPFKKERGVIRNLRKLQGFQEWYSSMKTEPPLDGPDSKGSYEIGLPDIRFAEDREAVEVECVLRGRDEHNSSTSLLEVRCMSWMVRTGNLVGCNTIDGEYRVFFALMLTSPWAIEPVLQVCDCKRVLEVFPLDDMVYQEYLQTDSGRLWLWKAGGLSFVELADKFTGMQAPEKPPPQLPLLPIKSAMKGEFDVFISHAGPDKDTIAIPLYECLKARGISAFVDRVELKGGDKGADKMEAAMETADIGVVITSPEYVVRKWTMKELMCFLRRSREAEAAGEVRVYIIPVFYRLNSDECKGKNLLKHLNVWGEEGFLERAQTEEENLVRKVTEAMRDLTTHTGILNLANATNRPRDHAKRVELVDRIVRAVMEKREKLLGM